MIGELLYSVEEVLPGLIVALFSVLLVYYIYRSRGLPPGPWGLPVVGFLPWMDPARPHETLRELSREYGPIFSIRLGEVTTVVLSHPSLVREALSREAFSGRAPLWLTHGLMDGNGLIAVDGEKWKEQRKFVGASLRSLGAVRVGGKRAIMEEKILEAVRKTIMMIEEKMAADGEVDPCHILTHNLGNLVNILVFGFTFAQDDETWVWLQELAEESVRIVGFAGIINFLPAVRFLPMYRRILKFLKDGQIRTYNLYRQFARGEKLTKENIISMFLDASAKGKGKYFDDQQMVHLMADLFGAGVDTTLANLRWILLRLAIHPQVQADVQEELDNATGDKDLPSLEDLERCPYTEATIYEGMRISAAVPLGVPHGTLEEVNLAGYRIPAGTMVIVNVWALHKDPDLWPDPDTFNPKRFLSENGAVKRPEAFLPFLYGRRVCIGEELARMMLLMFTASLLRRFKIAVADDEAVLKKAMEGIPGITSGPGPVRLTFTPRQPSQ